MSTEQKRGASGARMGDGRADGRVCAGYTSELTRPPVGRERILEGISIPQIIAGAAAAATSMLLASQIGIAGSVIGAAVSSVVTVVTSQLYRRFLVAGADKLRQGRDALSADHVARADAHRDGRDDVASRPDGTHGARGARVAPVKLQARAAAERAANQRKIVLFSAVAAVVAVALCAGAILLATAGQGLGTKTEPLIVPSTQEIQNAEPSSGGTADAGADDSGDVPDENADGSTSTTPDDSAESAGSTGESDTDKDSGQTNPQDPDASGGQAGAGQEGGSQEPATPGSQTGGGQGAGTDSGKTPAN